MTGLEGFLGVTLKSNVLQCLHCGTLVYSCLCYGIQGMHDHSFDERAALTTNKSLMFETNKQNKTRTHIHPAPIFKLTEPSHGEDRNVQFNTRNKLTSWHTVHILTQQILYRHCAGC